MVKHMAFDLANILLSLPTVGVCFCVVACYSHLSLCLKPGAYLSSTQVGNGTRVMLIPGWCLADGLVRASLANGHGTAKDHSKQNGCHTPLPIMNRDVIKQVLQEPSNAVTNGFILDQQALVDTPHGWQSAQDTASTRSLDLACGEDSDVTMRYSSLGSDRSEGTDVSPELASPPLRARPEPVEPIRLLVPGMHEASERREIPGGTAHGAGSQSRPQSGKPRRITTGRCVNNHAAGGQGSGEVPDLGSHPMSGNSSAAGSTAGSSTGAKPSPLVSPDRAGASNVEAWMGTLLRQPIPVSACPSQPQSPAEMASTIQPGGPLLPVEAPPAQAAPASQLVPAPAAPSQGPGQPEEPPRMLSSGGGGRRHSWSADDFPGYRPQIKQVPASAFAAGGEDMRGRAWPAQNSGHLGPSAAHRRDPVNGMRPPVSASSMGYAAMPPMASSMQGTWQMQSPQLLSANSEFVRELQHRVHLQLQQQQQQQQQQQRGFLHQPGEQRAPVRTRSLPKMAEQQGQWVQNGRIPAGGDQWHLPASHALGQPSSQAFPHERQPGSSSGKQATVQHIEALSHHTAGRSRQEQVRGLHRMGFSLPTTPVAGHQGMPFPSSAAAVRVQLSEGPAVWMGAADAMQLALAQHHSSKPSDAPHAPAGDSRKHRENGEGAQPPPPPPPRSGANAPMQRQNSTQVHAYLH